MGLLGPPVMVIKGQKKQRTDLSFRNSTSGSGQSTGPNRPRNFSTHFSGTYRSPKSGNNKGQSKQNSGFKSDNDRLTNTGKLGSREPPICFAFDQYEQAFCEVPHNQCQHKRLHKCQTCGHWGCKSPTHSQHRPTSRPQAHVITYDAEIFYVTCRAKL